MKLGLEEPGWIKQTKLKSPATQLRITLSANKQIQTRRRVTTQAHRAASTYT